MARHDSPSGRSGRLAARDRQALLDSLAVVDGLNAAGVESDPVAAGFDPALDLPLGIEPVGMPPREIALSETDLPFDVLPKTAVVQAAVGAAVRAAGELGYPVAGVGYGLRGRHRRPVRFDDRKTNPPRQSPPFIRVDLTGGATRDAITAGLIRAVMKASRSPRRPQKLLPTPPRRRTGRPLARCARPAAPRQGTAPPAASHRSGVGPRRHRSHRSLVPRHGPSGTS